jgi:hypothetical protein
MAYTYIQAIGIGFPGVHCHAHGDGSIYSDIIWDSGAALPSQTTLEQWIAANPVATVVSVTKYEFRKLFTLPERMAVDSAPTNTAIPANYRAMLYTFMKDLELSQEVQLTNTDVIQGVGFLEQLGLLAPGRAATILSNTPHA